MRIIICPDSFKGSISAADAAFAIDSGVKRALPTVITDCIPLADGGEGTIDAIINALGGEIVMAQVTGPLGLPVDAVYGVVDNRNTAVIEMSQAAGLHLVPNSCDPRYTTTYGVGELILYAYKRGCRKFIVGIGGSATNDGGAGAMSALGIRFLDAEEQILPNGGAALSKLAKIDTSGLKLNLNEVEIRVACDVTNPLIGPAGASAVYGPQKGATPETVVELDAALANYAQIIKSDLGIDIAYIPGAGAAGGLGGGLAAFLSGRLESGIDIVFDVTNFSERIKGTDLIITGEGRVDEQSGFGKTISGVVNYAHTADIPVVILAGSIGKGIEVLYSLGATAIFSIAPGPITIEESILRVGELLSLSAENCIRLFVAGRE
jgi:glycerate kinase